MINKDKVRKMLPNKVLVGLLKTDAAEGADLCFEWAAAYLVKEELVVPPGEAPGAQAPTRTLYPHIILL